MWENRCRNASADWCAQEILAGIFVPQVSAFKFELPFTLGIQKEVVACCAPSRASSSSRELTIESRFTFFSFRLRTELSPSISATRTQHHGSSHFESLTIPASNLHSASFPLRIERDWSARHQTHLSLEPPMAA